MNTTKIKKPTGWQMIYGILILMIRQNLFKPQIYLPLKKINEYTLLKEISKKVKPSNITLGIYGKSDKKYFVKTWWGKYKDFNYFQMLNACIITLYLQSINKNSKPYHFPNLIDLSVEDNNISAIYEYAQGLTLGQYDEQTQYENLIDAGKFISSLSSSIGKNNPFAKRGFNFYLFFLPIVTLVLIFLSHKNTIIILKSFKETWLKLIQQKSEKLKLAHRDLTPENIILSDSKKYILDVDNMALTFPYYDLFFIQSSPKYKNLAKIITQNEILPNDSFLHKFMLIYHSYAHENFLRVNQSFIKKLYE